jgi:tetratricopeptide (TPR) repeat protein
MRPMLAVAAIALAAGCGRSGSEARRTDAPVVKGARVGIDPVPAVTLCENHSEALIAWRRAGVRDRVLVHLDGHFDLDWLPDATIARVAAAEPDELAGLQLHPYAVEGKTFQRFGSWNFIYPAARLGIVRELVWVVPDGTLADPRAADDLVRRMILGRVQMISLDEAKTLHLAGRTIAGTILGLPVTICELADLPDFSEPVLLDLDLDFLTTRSATSQDVLEQARVAPAELVDRLRAHHVRTDLATVSYSTIGGSVPPECRWLGPAAAAALTRAPESDALRWSRRAEADVAARAGRAAEAAAALRVLGAAHPEDGSIWYALARADARSGRQVAEAVNRAKAVAADPVLADAALFEADTQWLNQRYAEALIGYREYRRQHPAGAFLAYASWREAGCLMRTGRADEGTALLRKVISSAPAHADARLDLGLLLRESGDLDGAIAQFLEARKIVPESGAYAMALGTTYARQGRTGEAVDALEAAVSRRPSWGEAQLDLGVLLSRWSRPMDAAAHLNAAAMLEPRDPQIARILSRLKRQGVSMTEVAAHP